MISCRFAFLISMHLVSDSPNSNADEDWAREMDAPRVACEDFGRSALERGAYGAWIAADSLCCRWLPYLNEVDF